MVLDYDINERLKDFLPVLDEYAGWFSHVNLVLSYPTEQSPNHLPVVPTTFMNWVNVVEEKGHADEVTVQLSRLNNDLLSLARELMIETLHKGKPPPYKEFARFLIMYEEFVQQIRRLERELILNDNGLDALTGLRNSTVLDKDYQREIDRLSRQGKPFCVALVRIDDLRKLKEKGDIQSVNASLKYVASLVKESMRSFDDAYRLRNDQLLIMLKQTDIMGGVRALERLRAKLGVSDFKINVEGVNRIPTLSSCIAEPVLDNTLEKIIEHLSEDLHDIAHEKNSVFEFYELSPLQRYARNLAE